MVEGFFKTQSKTKVKLNWKKGGGAVQVKSPQKTPVKRKKQNRNEEVFAVSKSGFYN